MPNNVKSCKKINEKAQTAKFTVFALWNQLRALLVNEGFPKGPHPVQKRLFFYSFYRTQVSWGPIYVSWCPSVTKRVFANLTDETLADHATNSTQTYEAIMTTLKPMHEASPDDCISS